MEKYSNKTVESKYGKVHFNIDDQQKILHIDKGFGKITGYTKTEVLQQGMAVKELISDEQYNLIQQDVMSQLTQESTALINVDIITKDGNRVNSDVYIEICIDEKTDKTIGNALIITKNYNEIRPYYKNEEQLVENMPIAFAIFSQKQNLDLELITANNNFYKEIGIENKEIFKRICGNDIGKLVNKEQYFELKKLFQQTTKLNELGEIEVRFDNPESGEFNWELLKMVPYKSLTQGELFRVYIFNITEQKKMEEHLAYLMERENTDTQYFEIRFKYDVKMDILIIYGESGEDVRRIANFYDNKKWKYYVMSDWWKDFEEAYENVIKEEKTDHLIISMSFEQGENPAPYRIYYKSVADTNARITKVVGRIVNIGRENSAKELLKKQAKIDSITGLYNKNYTKIYIDERINQKPKTGVLLIVDVDNFHVLNEIFGNMFGDAVIQNIAVGMKNIFRSEDIVGRISRDLFAVFVENVNRDIILDRAADVNKMVNNIYYGENDVFISSSIGISYYPDDGITYDALLEKSYTALQFAKQNGKNCVVEYGGYMDIKKVDLLEYGDEEYYRIENYDMDFLSFSFGLLVNSKDMDGSINLLLERIGRRYDIDLVFVADIENAQNNTYIKNIWERETSNSSKNDEAFEVSSIKDYLGEFDSQGIMYINNCKEKQTKFSYFYEKYGIISMVICLMYKNGELDGFTVFGDYTKAHEWTDFEKGTFKEMAKIITIFAELRKEKHKDIKKIDELSSRDMLTGLLNIDAFKKEATQLWSNYEKGTLCVIIYTDINDFSYINDNFGEQAGDRLLCSFADMLNKKHNTSRACRVYSDYFIVFAKIESKEYILNVVANNNVQFVNEQRKKYPQSELKLSTGIYFTSDPNEDIATAIDNANLARKRAKINKNLYEIYTEEMRLTRQYEQNMAVGLQDALKNGEFELFLQPKFLLGTKKVIGAEALVRWRKEDGTLRYPNDFIPIFEQIGHIVEVDYYIYEQVLICINRWKKQGKQLIPISVNFSRKHFLYDNFADEVTKLARFYEVEYNLIEIEITESIFSDDVERMMNIFEKLRSIGFIIDMDDFGTGYSSLNMLINAPIDIVKVDKSFMKTQNSQKGKKYVKQLAGLIQAAEKKVIFEGVETEEQEEFLLNCGYNMAQGYLLDKPMEVDEFERKYVKDSDKF